MLFSEVLCCSLRFRRGEWWRSEIKVRIWVSSLGKHSPTLHNAYKSCIKKNNGQKQQIAFRKGALFYNSVGLCSNLPTYCKGFSLKVPCICQRFQLEPSEIWLALSVWLRCSVVRGAQQLSGRPGFESRPSINFFRFFFFCNGLKLQSTCEDCFFS